MMCITYSEYCIVNEELDIFLKMIGMYIYSIKNNKERIILPAKCCFLFQEQEWCNDYHHGKQICQIELEFWMKLVMFIPPQCP